MPAVARRRRIAVIVIVAFLTVQVGVPAFQLVTRFEHQGIRGGSEYAFSWQMYSGQSTGRYFETLSDGSRKRVSTRPLPKVIRSVGYGTTVLRMLCDRHPGAVSMTRLGSTPEQGTLTC